MYSCGGRNFHMVQEILRIERLEKSFGDTQILSDIWMHILSGTTSGVVGLDNSGKTTFMKIIAGLSEWDFGKLFYKGK
jgi:ABC-type multidrug transport system ATPase subunit